MLRLPYSLVYSTLLCLGHVFTVTLKAQHAAGHTAYRSLGL